MDENYFLRNHNLSDPFILSCSLNLRFVNWNTHVVIFTPCCCYLDTSASLRYIPKLKPCMLADEVWINNKVLRFSYIGTCLFLRTQYPTPITFIQPLHIALEMAHLFSINKYKHWVTTNFPFSLPPPPLPATPYPTTDRISCWHHRETQTC